MVRPMPVPTSRRSRGSFGKVRGLRRNVSPQCGRDQRYLHGHYCLGIVYEYVKEAVPNASVFKLGISNPLPRQRLKRTSPQRSIKCMLLKNWIPSSKINAAPWVWISQGKKSFSRCGRSFRETIADRLLGKNRKFPTTILIPSHAAAGAVRRLPP